MVFEVEVSWGNYRRIDGGITDRRWKRRNGRWRRNRFASMFLSREIVK